MAKKPLKNKKAKKSALTKYSPAPIPVEPIGDELNEKQELFCQFFVNNRDTFGNRTQSYAEAYGFKLDELSKDDAVYAKQGKKKVLVKPSSYEQAYYVCAVSGSRLLKNVKVRERIRVLLNALLKDDVVDSRLAEHIMQENDGDLSLNGIKEYNRVRGRITDKTEITERFAMDDIRVLLSPLPKERQDQVYEHLAAAIAEADQLRRSGNQV